VLEQNWATSISVLPRRDQIETLRLCLEPFSSDDAAAAFAWFSDPEVMRFIPTGPDRLMGETKRRLARYIEHQTLHGFSKWIIRERASGQAIGDAGLVVLEDLGKIDLGFRFARSRWGRGLATEAASAWVRAAFVDFGLDRLTAFGGASRESGLTSSSPEAPLSVDGARPSDGHGVARLLAERSGIPVTRP
jgi:RimJ/RimL family protein N-acetyltransferase